MSDFDPFTLFYSEAAIQSAPEAIAATTIVRDFIPCNQKRRVHLGANPRVTYDAAVEFPVSRMTTGTQGFVFRKDSII